MLGLEIRGPIIERANRWAQELALERQVLFLRWASLSEEGKEGGKGGGVCASRQEGRRREAQGQASLSEEGKEGRGEGDARSRQGRLTARGVRAGLRATRHSQSPAQHTRACA
jgi:hypothetical protein